MHPSTNHIEPKKLVPLKRQFLYEAHSLSFFAVKGDTYTVNLITQRQIRRRFGPLCYIAWTVLKPVSYTHLTLPTKRIV